MKKSADPLKRHIPAHPSKKFMNRYISLVWTQTLCFWLKCITYTVDNVHPPPQEVYEYIHIAGFWLNWIQYPVDNVHPPPTPKEVYEDIKVPGLNPNSMFWLDCWGLFFTPPLEPIGGENICRKNKRRCQILPYKIQT